MAHKLSDREHRRLENLARKGDLHRLYAAIADFHAPLNLSRPLLLGTSQKEELYVEGFLPLNRILDNFHSLDPKFDQHAITYRVLTIQKRPSIQRTALRGPVRGTIHGNFAKAFPSLCFLNHTGNCSGPIIRAHAVQEAQLKPHSDNGKVYFGSPFERGGDGEVAFKHLTVRTATTFRGFCAHHDNTTFRPIETVPFVGTKEQLFLYHYRALCKDYYLRLVTKNYFTTVSAALVSQGLGSQLNFVRDVLAMTQGDIDEFVAGKPQYDAALANQNFGILAGCWMRGQGIPGLIGTTLLFPPADLLGRPYLNRTSVRLQNWISVTTTIENNAPLTIIAGLSNSPYFQHFLQTIRAIPPNEMPAILVRFALCLSENFVLIPKWWEGLTHDERRAARIIFTNRFYTPYFQGKPDWSWDPPTFF